jgi:Flp pilus assembly protein TadB
MIRFLTSMEHEESFWAATVLVVAVGLWFVTTPPVAMVVLGLAATVFVTRRAREAARLKRQPARIRRR